MWKGDKVIKKFHLQFEACENNNFILLWCVAAYTESSN